MVVVWVLEEVVEEQLENQEVHLMLDLQMVLEELKVLEVLEEHLHTLQVDLEVLYKEVEVDLVVVLALMVVLEVVDIMVVVAVQDK